MTISHLDQPTAAEMKNESRCKKIMVQIFFSRPSPKAGRELQTELKTRRRRMMEGGPLAEPEPVTGP